MPHFDSFADFDRESDSKQRTLATGFGIHAIVGVLASLTFVGMLVLSVCAVIFGLPAGLMWLWAVPVILTLVLAVNMANMARKMMS